MNDDISYRKLVLCVDDEEHALLLYKGLLRDEYDLALARSVPEAVEYLQTHRADAVISDYHMPEMDGLLLVQKMREMGVETPVLINSNDVDNTQARAFGAISTGRKEFIELPRTLKAILS